MLDEGTRLLLRNPRGAVLPIGDASGALKVSLQELTLLPSLLFNAYRNVACFGLVILLQP